MRLKAFSTFLVLFCFAFIGFAAVPEYQVVDDPVEVSDVLTVLPVAGISLVAESNAVVVSTSVADLVSQNVPSKPLSYLKRSYSYDVDEPPNYRTFEQRTERRTDYEYRYIYKQRPSLTDYETAPRSLLTIASIQRPTSGIIARFTDTPMAVPWS